MKPIFDSKNKKNIQESSNTASFIQSGVLILLHPFIPFFTEKVWLDFKFNKHFKSSIMYKDWNFQAQASFKESHSKVDWLINLVSNIRSTKVDLEVSPGSYIDISIDELSSKKKYME